MKKVKTEPTAPLPAEELTPEAPARPKGPKSRAAKAKAAKAAEEPAADGAGSHQESRTNIRPLAWVMDDLGALVGIPMGSRQSDMILVAALSQLRVYKGRDR